MNKRHLIATARLYEYDPDSKSRLIVELAKKLREKPRREHHNRKTCVQCRPR